MCVKLSEGLHYYERHATCLVVLLQTKNRGWKRGIERKGLTKGTQRGMGEGMRNDETRKVWILHLTIFNVPCQWESVFKAVNSVTLLPSPGTASTKLELENFPSWFYGPGLTSSSFPHQNRELADTIYSGDSWENNYSCKKLNHTPIKIAFNQCWCLMKSAWNGSTKINSDCTSFHCSLHARLGCTYLHLMQSRCRSVFIIFSQRFSSQYFLIGNQ